MTLKNCTSCGIGLDADAVFCDSCGSSQTADLSVQQVSTSTPKTNAVQSIVPLSVGDDTNHCTKCGRAIDRAFNYCVHCSKDFPEQPGSNRTNAQTQSKNPLSSRYLDAYRIAKTLDGAGQLIKTFGLMIAGGLVFLGLVLAGSVAGNFRGPDASGVGGIVFFLFGLIAALIGLISWVIGIFVSALGQLLKADIDAAVNTSPFLTNSDRAEVMSLPQLVVRKTLVD